MPGCLRRHGANWSGWPERPGSACGRAIAAWPLVWPVRLGAMPMPANSNGCVKRVAQAQGLHWSGAARHRAAVGQGSGGQVEGAPGRDDCAGEPAAGARCRKTRKSSTVYDQHEPAVDCISRGKAHKRYEFGTRVSVATTNRGGFVIGIRALSGNPCHDQVDKMAA